MSAAKVSILALFAVALFGCSDATSGPGDVVTEDPGSSSTEPETIRASLEGALPADGDSVSGEFLVAAVLDGTNAEVRFMIDGAEVGVVNEAPFQLKLNACDLSGGNHFFMVVVEGSDGESQHVEQWFSSSCE